jgi:hypothetical protein
MNDDIIKRYFGLKHYIRDADFELLYLEKTKSYIICNELMDMLFDDKKYSSNERDEISKRLNKELKSRDEIDYIVKTIADYFYLKTK